MSVTRDWARAKGLGRAKLHRKGCGRWWRRTRSSAVDAGGRGRRSANNEGLQLEIDAHTPRHKYRTTAEGAASRWAKPPPDSVTGVSTPVFSQPLRSCRHQIWSHRAVTAAVHRRSARVSKISSCPVRFGFSGQNPGSVRASARQALASRRGSVTVAPAWALDDPPTFRRERGREGEGEREGERERERGWAKMLWKSPAEEPTSRGRPTAPRRPRRRAAASSGPAIPQQPARMRRMLPMLSPSDISYGSLSLFEDHIQLFRIFACSRFLLYAHQLLVQEPLAEDTLLIYHNICAYVLMPFSLH